MMGVLHQIIVALFPDATAIWAALAAIAAAAAVIVSVMSHRFQRRTARSPEPVVSVVCEPLADVPNWFRAWLTIGNTLPHMLSCKAVSLVKPRRGIVLYEEREMEKGDGYGNRILDTGMLRQNLAAVGRRTIPLAFDIARAGVRGVPHTGSLVRQTGDHESRSFLVFAEPKFLSTRPNSPTTLSMSICLDLHDRIQSEIVIALKTRLTAARPSTVQAASP